MAVKDALAEKTSRKNEAVKLTKNMSIADMIKAMEPEIKKALPQVITPERFTRMALSAPHQSLQSVRRCPSSGH